MLGPQYSSHTFAAFHKCVPFLKFYFYQRIADLTTDTTESLFVCDNRSEDTDETSEMKPYVMRKRPDVPNPKRLRGEGRTKILYQCKECKEMCKTFRYFRRHYEKKHLKLLGFAAAETRSALVHGNKQLYNVLYRCKPCNKIFEDSEIVNHRKIHDKVNDVCDTCGKVYTIRTSFLKHLRIHEAHKTGRKKQCKLCGKTFAVISDLKQHMKYHSKERSHICEVCGKGFKERCKMFRHREIHNDTKRFTCHFCGKGFIQAYRLTEHVRTHTGEKPFQCNICNSSFAQKQAVRAHKKAVHGVDKSEFQKPRVQEFEAIDPYDPKLYENCTVQINSEEDTIAISWQHEGYQKSSDIKEPTSKGTSASEAPPSMVSPSIVPPSMAPHVTVFAPDLNKSLLHNTAPAQTLHPHFPGSSGKIQEMFQASNVESALSEKGASTHGKTSTESGMNMMTSEISGLSYTSL